MQPHMPRGSKLLSPVDPKSISKTSFTLSPSRHIHHAIWLQIKKRVLIYEHLLAANLIWLPNSGVSPPLGQNNRSLTMLSLRRTVFSSSSGHLFLPFSNVRTPTRLCMQPGKV